MVKELSEAYFKTYGRKPEHQFFCPGRVNLIGEHIDYNGGEVLPCAIGLGTYLAVSKNTDKLFRFKSLDFDEAVDLHLQQSYSKTGKQWFNYPLGVINEMIKNGATVSGLDMLFHGNLPIGAGLSSSASIEVLTAFALNKLFRLDYPEKELAVLGKKVENEFIGMNCGIMDQFAVAMGRKDKAILLNCDTLQHAYIPFHTGELSLVVINTNKKRSLTDSKYNERFAECGKALDVFKTELELENLCQLNAETLYAHAHLLHGTVLWKRARHVVLENERVRQATAALRNGDLQAVGRLMFASHESLREDYEVSGKELDTIVDFCKSFDGVEGARMTGAGFGGCAIALVQSDKVKAFSDGVTRFYEQQIGYPPGVFLTEPADGVRALPEPLIG